MTTLDERLNSPDREVARSASALEACLSLAVDWSPAYELLISLEAFIKLKAHPLLDLGPLWGSRVHDLLPPESANLLARKSTARSLNDDDLLARLVLACPDKHDAPAFLSWFGQLTAGGAYEALASLAPEPGPRLPRDFTTWRDAVLDLLGVWNTVYFRHLDRRILDGLRHDAERLKTRLDTADPVALVEEVTNGITPEPSAGLRSVTLVPQYHHRPYNTDFAVHDGMVILYPCEALPADTGAPPSGLLRLTRALGDESRLRMLRFLANGTSSLTEVARFAGLSQPTVHHHLIQLRTAGLIRVHCTASAPSRYSLRPHALEQLSQQLQAYLEVADP